MHNDVAKTPSWESKLEAIVQDWRIKILMVSKINFSPFKWGFAQEIRGLFSPSYNIVYMVLDSREELVSWKQVLVC